MMIITYPIETYNGQLPEIEVDDPCDKIIYVGEGFCARSLQPFMPVYNFKMHPKYHHLPLILMFSDGKVMANVQYNSNMAMIKFEHYTNLVSALSDGTLFDAFLA